ncbi:MAG: TonB-dependent receptor [Bryobacteraceae bacterium]|nr:TonB-dependent receptor [Bryobacteraceae bacterium]
MKKLIHWWAVLVLATIPLALSAQTVRGTLTGTVLDATGAAVPGATVTLTNDALGVKIATQTSTSGVYTLPEVRFGTYSVTVAQKGFQTVSTSNVIVAANQVTRFDTSLQVGDVSTTVEVTAEAPLLQQDTSAVQTNVSTKQLVELPLALGGFGTRSPEAFVFLTPGQSGDIFMSSSNGGQTFSNSVLIDGGSAGRSWSPGNFDESSPSVDAIGEMTIKTNAFSAEYGRTGSSITSFALRSGSNQYHGVLYEFLRNQKLDAKGFYHNQNLTDRKNDFGGTIGGPFVIPKLYNGRNKTFFFFSFEGFRTKLPYTGTRRFPTERQQQGDFGELAALANPILIYDPLTRQPFPQNVIPQNRLSSVSRFALPFFPKPNLLSQGSGLRDQYIATIPTSVNQDLVTSVVDHNFNEANRVHFSWSRRQNDRTRDPENLIPFDNPLTQGRLQNYNTNQWRASLDTIITPRLLNHLNLSTDRVRSTNGSVTLGQNFVQSAGLAGVSNTHTSTQEIEGYTTLGNGEVNTAYDTRFELANHVTWTRNTHTFKFGIDLRRTHQTQQALNNSAGTFRFRPISTSGPDGSGGDAFASYLLGAVHNAQTAVWLTTPGWRYMYYSGFVQDDWKITSRLTLNLGLRYDLEKPRHEQLNRHSSLDPSLANPLAGGIPGALAIASDSRRTFDKTDKNNFGPRVGFAWSPTNSTVIRGGYGLYYNLLFYNDFGEAGTLGFNANPLFESPNGRDPAFYWQNGFPQNFARPPFTDPSALNGQNIDLYDANGKPPYVSSWNLGVERAVGGNMRVSAFYVANKGTRLYRAYNVQQLRPEQLRLGDLLTRRIDDPSVVAAGFRSPYPNFIQDWGNGATLNRALRRFPQYSNVNYVNNTDGNSTYNSLQLKAENRFKAGLTLLVAYTWAKHLTNADSASQWNSAGLQNDYDTRQGKSVSRSDRPHVLAVSYIYELPFGRGKKFLNKGGAVNKIVGGWQTNATLRYQSGPPLEFGADCPSITQVNAGFCRPSFTGSQEFTGPGKENVDPNARQPYLNAAAFTVPSPYTYGNVSRTVDFIRGWNFASENLAVFKNTQFTERVNLQFRAEAFNAFNRTIFNQPDTFVGQYNASSPGNVQRNQNFGFYQGQANESRQIQLGLKLIF